MLLNQVDNAGIDIYTWMCDCLNTKEHFPYCRVVMKKKVHKKTTVKDGKEETIVTTDMHVEHDDKGPEDLQAAMKEIIENFVEVSYNEYFFLRTDNWMVTL